MIHPIYTELTECRDCYKCVRGCPVKAIQVKNGSAVVVKDRCIYCSLAPSAASEFPEGVDALVLALHRLGFSAALVNESIEVHAQSNGGTCSWISTACPTVVQTVLKYYPSLAKVPSPLQCHSAYLRTRYGQELAVVFIGPGIPNKVESDETPGYPDFAFTSFVPCTGLNLENLDFVLHVEPCPHTN